MGCQTSAGESTGSWEESQDLLGTSLIWALLTSVMCPGHTASWEERRLERIRSRREKPPWGSWEGFPDLWCGRHLLKEGPSH